jgi:hypothetical protein
MIIVGIGAFAWADAWWATALLIALALAIGWYSLGIYARASSAAAQRVFHGVATDQDREELDHLGGRAREEAFRAAASAHDPVRDQIFQEHIDRMGGLDAARQLVIMYMTNLDLEVDDESADALLDEWRLFGLVQNASIGEYLDEHARRHG